ANSNGRIVTSLPHHQEMVPPAPNGSCASAGFGLAPVDSTARPQILAIWRQFTERGNVSPIASRAAATGGSGPPTRGWPVPLDRVHHLAVLAVLPLHVDRNDGVQRRNEKGDGKN